MKFGKQIQAQQVPSWASAYLDYKGLKKIINSLAKGRPAVAALLASGISPNLIPSTFNNNSGLEESDRDQTRLVSLSEAIHHSPEGNLVSHKAAFFFKLERELEKINSFYLQKEAELKVRLRTLVDKRSLVQLSRTKRLTKDNSSFTALYEGFRYFEKDLRKLQTFVELNQTGFRKILKKWDKRSKSTTKELYLSRQVEVQPVFNRECIAELNDVAAANVLELEELLVDSDTRSHSSDPIPDQIPNEWKSVATHPQPDIKATIDLDIIEFEELETNLIQAVKADNRDQVMDLLRALPVPASPHDQPSSVRSRLGRILWRAALSVNEPTSATISTSQPASSRITILTPSTAMAERELVPSSRLDFMFVDDISGRTCLHEAASAGRTQLISQAVEHKVAVSTPDVYGRQALHYAAMNGFSNACRLLLSYHADPYSLDHDGYTPIIYAVQKGHVDCVRILLDSGVSLEPSKHAGLIPLSLACQYGHKDITLMMLKRGAQILANPEGMSPQHLAARGGHATVLSLLVDAGADLDEPDTYSRWTPLFHAAAEGHSECVKVLIDAGCNCQCLDETRKPPIHHAAWRGHINCVNLLLAQPGSTSLATQIKGEGESSPERLTQFTSTPGQARTVPGEAIISSGSLMTGSSAEFGASEQDGDLIPDLSLPPPIIPFRIYGHNYLDKKALIQLFLGHPNTCRSGRQPVQLYGQPELTSLKLVITNRSDVLSAVHSTILPLEYERESFTFHTDSVDQFTIEFELFPTFGTKIMGKAVGLSSTFERPWHQRPCLLPILDKHLKVIGEVAFELNVVRPFEGVQLSFGGQVETYWKAMTNLTVSTAPLDSPSVSPLGTPSMNHVSNAFVTASSLSGQYVQVVIQVTKDGIPVLYADEMLSIQGFEIPVCDVTCEQFMSLAKQSSKTVDYDLVATSCKTSATHWHKIFRNSMITLESVLERLPCCLGLDLEIYEPRAGAQSDLNGRVDAIFKTIYEAASKTTWLDEQSGTLLRRRRRLVLSSTQPLICTALNWKQPNYAVFFVSDCGVFEWDSIHHQLMIKNKLKNEFDNRSTSILEAVKFAKANNLLGVRLNSTLLLRVPSLIQSIKEIGLLLSTYGNESKSTLNLGVDGYMSNEGVLEYCSGDDLELVNYP